MRFLWTHVVFALTAAACDTGSSGAPATTEPEGGTSGTDAGSDAGERTDAASGAAADARSEDTGSASNTHFSFFVTSLAAMQKLSGKPDGFGGDLRYGETGQGSGLRGADKICATIAEQSLTGAGAKTWRAFLSAKAAGENGAPVHAIDRIGSGPWYDRLGRLVASNVQSLLSERPADADPSIINDLPNENGTPNHNPDGQGERDNHDTLTGSGDDGKLYTQTAGPTCEDWTSSVGSAGTPRVGHSWIRNVLGSGSSGLSGRNWISSLEVSGCAPGAVQDELGVLVPNAASVGSASGYGGIYCFALQP